jgi:hypothetical protein
MECDFLCSAIGKAGVNRIKYITHLTLLLLIITLKVNGQAVLTGTVSKSTVALNEQFQLTYSLNGNGRGFQSPDLHDFNILGGPNQSSQVQLTNGSFSQSISFTYILQPKAEGTFKIGFASIEADGKRIQSNGLIVTVVKGNAAAQQGQKNGDQESAGVSEKNIFLRAEVNKSSVYQGESVTVTFKLYTNVNIVNYTVSKSPALNGFWSQDIELPEQLQLSNATVDGVNYKVGVLKKVVLFPQQNGTLYIDPMELECIARIQVKGRNPFGVFQNDPFFNDPFFGFGSARDVKYAFKSNRIAVNVKALPEGAPESFNGSVGELSFDASLDKTTTNANEPVSLKIKISGTGNMKLIEPPALEFPADIESYDPKINDNLKVNESGVSGSKTIEYLLIPRHEGTYELQPVKFSYFDLAKKQYISRSAGPFHLKVGKGSGPSETSVSSSISKSDFQLLGKDIRYIKLNDQEFTAASGGFYGSPGFYALIIAPFVAAGGLMWYRQRMQILNSDVASVRSRKATELARKRLSAAQKHMTAGANAAFFEEVSRAMWGYISDRLSIPTADLSRDALTAALQKRQVTDDSIKSFLHIIDECEMARFAGASSADTAGIYQQAVQSITGIEQSLKT